ncbi:MAG: hypothetical protein H0X43_04785 [Nitrosospira sp.]|nr:hypothetical protein [Nitrosospira sp.]
MKKLVFGAGLLTLAGMLLPGCVTINIYFPAAAAEKAADKIIEEVWQLKKPEEGAPGPDRGADTSVPAPDTSSQPATPPRQPLQL